MRLTSKSSAVVRLVAAWKNPDHKRARSAMLLPSLVLSLFALASPMAFAQVNCTFEFIDWTEAQIDPPDTSKNFNTTLAGQNIGVVAQATGPNPITGTEFSGESFIYTGSVDADAGLTIPPDTSLNGNVQLALDQDSNLGQTTRVEFTIPPGQFHLLNLFLSDNEYTDVVVYVEDGGGTRLSTADWDITSYEQNGTTPASNPNPVTVNPTDLLLDAVLSTQNDDVMRIRFDPITLLTATTIVIETERVSLAATVDISEYYLSGCVAADFGDAPDNVYNTLSANNGPSHRAQFFNPDTNTTPLMLGSLYDIEVDGQPVAGANGDDNLGAPNDEEGVTFSSPGGDNINALVNVTNTTGAPVTVCGWLDVNDSNGFELGERQCNTAIDPSTTFNWVVSSSQTINYFSRFRVCSTAAECMSPTGPAEDGEVEDYVVTYNPTIVTIGNVELEAISVTEFLTGLDPEGLDRATLLALLTSWDAERAATLAGANRAAILTALLAYLDPDGDGHLAVLKWDTLEERGTVGYYVERRDNEGVWQQINTRILPALVPAPLGGEYQLADPEVRLGNTYQYRFIEQEATGNTRQYGPYRVEIR